MKVKDIDTKAARARLKVQGKPHWMILSGGISLGYRRTQSGAGTWSVRIADGKGRGPIKRLAVADDLAAADDKHIMTYAQARDAALKFANGDGKGAAPVVTTLGEAVEAYKADLEARRADQSNAARLLAHLSPTMLKRPVALLSAKELADWRNALQQKLEPAGVNRLITILRAALNLAAKHTKGLDADAWKVGLQALPNAKVANNRVLTNDQVVALVHAAREYRADFGLMVEVLAQTGARYSQIARCEVRHLRDNRLMVPSSFKGKGKEAKLIPVPLSDDLIARLRLAAGDRAGSDRLLRKASGDRWGHKDIDHRFDAIVKAIGEDPADITSLALRHTHITAQLMAGLPVQLVGKLHDTSAQMIEDHYAAEIASQADDLVRGAMLQIDRPQANVVPLRSK